jgi:urease accessory protein
MPADEWYLSKICEVQNMNKLKFWKLVRIDRRFQQVIMIAMLVIGLLLTATPVLAHHMMGSKMPANFWQGLLSGIGHPLIRPDHLAFIIAVGLLAAMKRQGFLIPISFVLAAMLGTGIHLANLSLWGVELFVSASILLFGILLVIKDRITTSVAASLAAIAGIFHGYAYGESIFGAETTPLLAYLIGFTLIQISISLVAFWIGKKILFQRTTEPNSARLRPAGWVLCGVGLAFLMAQLT